MGADDVPDIGPLLNARIGREITAGFPTDCISRENGHTPSMESFAMFLPLLSHTIPILNSAWFTRYWSQHLFATMAAPQKNSKPGGEERREKRGRKGRGDSMNL